MGLEREFLPKHGPLTTGDEITDVDLTLRLGLPFHDSRKRQEDEKGNLTGQDETLDGFQVQGCSIPHRLSNEESRRPYFLQDTIPYPPMPGSDDDQVRRPSGMPRACKECGSERTPLWRKGPEGPQTLCNACGIRYSRNLKKK